MERQVDVQQGYRWLKDETGAAVGRLQSIENFHGAKIIADDQFFRPIHTTFQQGVVQCLINSLDHLRFLAWSLESRDMPFPYAQASLIRTAITAASTATWMVSGKDSTERLWRAMQFIFNDLKSHRKWMETVASEPINQQRPQHEKEIYDNQLVEIERQLDWIVGKATELSGSPIPLSRRTYADKFDSDSEIVRSAGSIVPIISGDGWDSGITLSHTWQLLSGYAHARPWASMYGGKNVVKNATPDEITGTIEVSPQGDPHTLLDFAFRALRVTDAGIDALKQLAA